MALLVFAGRATGGILRPTLRLPPYTTGGLGWVYLCLLAGLMEGYFVTTATLHHRWVRRFYLCLQAGLLEGYFVPLYDFHLTPQVG
jgi:hypothetical protein